MQIKPEELDEAIKNVLETASEELKKKIDRAGDAVTQEGVSELKRTSPKYTGNKKRAYRPGAYARSWTVKRDFSGITGNSHYTIHNVHHYRLTHLLEFGHVNRDGSRARAFPHIAKVNADVCAEYEKKVEKIINDM